MGIQWHRAGASMRAHISCSDRIVHGSLYLGNANPDTSFLRCVSIKKTKRMCACAVGTRQAHAQTRKGVCIHLSKQYVPLSPVARRLSDDYLSSTILGS